MISLADKIDAVRPIMFIKKGALTVPAPWVPKRRESSAQIATHIEKRYTVKEVEKRNTGYMPRPREWFMCQET